MSQQEKKDLSEILKFFFNEFALEPYLRQSIDLYFVFSKSRIIFFTDQDIQQDNYIEDQMHRRSLSSEHPFINKVLPHYQELVQDTPSHLQLDQLFSSRFQTINKHSFSLSLLDRDHFMQLGLMPSLFDTVNTGFILRLSHYTPLSFLDSDHQKLIQRIESEDDLLILVEQKADLMSLASWLTQYTKSIEYPLSGSQQALPYSWHWLFLNQLPNMQRYGHWQVPNLYLYQCANSATFLHYCQTALPQVQKILSLSTSGELSAQTLSTAGWESESLFSKIPNIQPADQHHSQDDEQAFVIDYEEVMSGLGSEASTLQVSMDQVIPKEENISIEPIAPVIPKEENKAKQDLLTQDQFDDFDQSEVIEISLSELPLPEDEAKKESAHTNEFEDPSFEEVKSALQSKKSLVINRSITPPQHNKSSMVTIGGGPRPAPADVILSDQTIPHKIPSFDDLHALGQQEEEFDYQTINQVKTNQTGAQSPYTIEKNDYVSTADFDSIQEHQLNELSSDLDLALAQHENDHFDFNDESVPTRVDIDTAQVLQALETERQDAVTRVATKEDKTFSKPADPLSMDEHKTEVAPINTEAPNPSQMDREALSREDTAKLNVRDFEMLTDIKDRPQSTPPPPPRTGQVSAPPLPQSPPVSYTVPFHSSVQPQSRAGSPQINNAKLNQPPPPFAESRQPNRNHKDRRSFSDVIRSLTSKNKP